MTITSGDSVVLRDDRIADFDFDDRVLVVKRKE